MRADEKSRARVGVGSIVQVDPEAGTDYAGLLGVVFDVGRAGPRVNFSGKGIATIVWASVEPTGGKAVWVNGKKTGHDVPEALRHHP